MNKNRPFIQDLSDILQIHKERAAAYNTSAYACGHMLLKLMLHREVDNARDSTHSILRLLHDRFSDVKEPDTMGSLYTFWHDSKPSFEEQGVLSQLKSFEIADALTLQCYELMLGSPGLDNVSKRLLEFQYQNHQTIFESLKGLKTVTLSQHSHFFEPEKSIVRC